MLSKMTLEEKVAQMIQVPYKMVGREESLRWAEMGAGSFLHVLGDDAREIQETARKTRLGIPVLFGIDAIHGHGLNDHATIFPSQLAAACSWDPDQIRRIGEITAREVATDGLHWTFSPVLCLGRDTRWGRIDETFGEDPTLAGILGAAIIEGYQGKDLSDNEHILACAKHYLGYGEAVGARDACDSECTERKIREVFLPPFARAVKAGCATIMTAYGSIDGTPLTIHRRLLHELLRDELGFDGFVVTDWDNVRSLVTRQHVRETLADASVAAAEAGNDMIMTTLEFYDAMLEAIARDPGRSHIVDAAVLHILTIKYEMGLFEQPEKKGRPGCIGCEAHTAAALEAARSTITLLKNDGMLPLSRDIHTVAVIGPNADDLQAQYGDWTYFSHPMPDREHPPVRPFTTFREGMEHLGARHGVRILYAKGCSQISSPEDDLDAAVRLAEQADAVFFACGDMIDQIGESKDRADLSLSGRQDELFSRLISLGKPVCTVLISSKPLCIPMEAALSNAVICAFNGGMFGGEAIAEAAFGELNPSGHLPISFPRHSGQVPVYYNYLPGWHNGKYCDLPDTPLFAFGEGLSYTSFNIENLEADPETLEIHFHLMNTGTRAGIALVQIYVRDLVSSVLTPVKRLAAFKRVSLEAGEQQKCVIQLSPDDFSLITADGRTVVEPGDFRIMAGFSSREEDLTETIIRLS